MKDQYNYFIVYQAIGPDNDLRVGNTVAKVRGKMTGIEDIREVEAGLVEAHGYDSVIVTSFTLF